MDLSGIMIGNLPPDKQPVILSFKWQATGESHSNTWTSVVPGIEYRLASDDMYNLIFHLVTDCSATFIDFVYGKSHPACDADIWYDNNLFASQC